MTPAVSVVMPSYNSARFLRAAVDSVLGQTYADLELIVADDGSTDDSLALLREYESRDSRVRVLALGQRQGPAVARNAGIRAANGSFIAFLDSDDAWLPAKLERHLEFMRKNDAVLSYTSYRKIQEDDSLGGLVDVPSRVDYHAMLYTNSNGCSTAIYDATRLGKVYFPDIIRRQDHGLWLGILRKQREAHGLSEPLTLYRIRKSSVSSNKLVAAAYQWQLYRRVVGLSFASTLIHFAVYFYSGVRKMRM